MTSSGFWGYCTRLALCLLQNSHRGSVQVMRTGDLPGLHRLILCRLVRGRNREYRVYPKLVRSSQGLVLDAVPCVPPQRGVMGPLLRVWVTCPPQCGGLSPSGQDRPPLGWSQQTPAQSRAGVGEGPVAVGAWSCDEPLREAGTWCQRLLLAMRGNGQTLVG